MVDRTIQCPHCEKKIDLEIHRISIKASKHMISKRMRCDECQDHHHGCFGSGKDNGLGHSHCVKWVEA